MEKKGTLRQKRRPKGDPNPQKGPLGDPGPQGDPPGHSDYHPLIFYSSSSPCRFYKKSRGPIGLLDFLFHTLQTLTLCDPQHRSQLYTYHPSGNRKEMSEALRRSCWPCLRNSCLSLRNKIKGEVIQIFLPGDRREELHILVVRYPFASFASVPLTVQNGSVWYVDSSRTIACWLSSISYSCRTRRVPTI